MNYAAPPRLLLALLLLPVTMNVTAQDVPADFEIMATAGGLAPDTENMAIIIAADGQGSYVRFIPGEPNIPLIESASFTLDQADMETLWMTIQNSGFLDLDSEFSDDSQSDGSFVMISIVADGSVHDVSVQNIAIDAVDQIVSMINASTPGDDDLVYDMSEPFTFTSLDICEQPGKRSSAVPPNVFGKAATSLSGRSLPAGSHATPGNTAHAGTVVGYRMSLQEAVDRGIADLSGKGEYFGDAVSISVDNIAGETTNDLELSLYLEHWGESASTSNSQVVENAIESTWGGMTTSDGRPLSVDVISRTASGATSAPGTSGFHQIKLVESVVSYVDGLGSSFDVNEGVGSGAWETTGDLLNEIYAHEAGHLFGLDDRYDDFRKQPDGNWKQLGSDQVFTTSELASEIAPRYDDFTEQETEDWLNSGITRVGPPMEGHENDIMADLESPVQQSDIDALADRAGLIVEVRPGTILVNRSGFQQNFVITRSEDIFVPRFGSKTLDGLYAACIDKNSGIPSEGTEFDLAPSLAEWRGIEAASFLQNLVDYVDEQELFCGFDIETQLAIWRVTDNSYIGDELVEQFLDDAGIDLGDRLLDFPRMSNSTSTGEETLSLVPFELYVTDVLAAPDNVIEVGETVTLSSTLEAPSLEDVTTQQSWFLFPPSESGATLSNPDGETTSFTADLRGIYQVQSSTQISGATDLPFTLLESYRVTASDEWTETFETGVLETEEPFFWEQIGGNPWAVSDDISNTGAFAASSAHIEDTESSSLRVRFSQSSAEAFSFSVKTISELDLDVMTMTVDGEVENSWSGDYDWWPYSVNLGAGDHSVSWTYSKDDSFSDGADRAWIDDVFFPKSAIFTAIERRVDEAVPGAHRLLQNYPNPFGRSTVVVLELPDTEWVSLVLYDTRGRRVAVLAEGMRSPGRYEITFNAGGLSNGVYFYELKAGAFSDVQTMIIAK